MAKKTKMVSVEEGYLEFLKEKAGEMLEYKRQLTIAKFEIEQLQRVACMTETDWKMYYDYIDNEWVKLSPEDKAAELAFAKAMADRSPAGKDAFFVFIEKLRGIETKEDN